MRMTKLYSTDMRDTSPISQIIKCLVDGKRVKCADYQMIYPTYVEDIARAIDLLIQKSLLGIYRVVGSDRFTRYSLGQLIATTIGKRAWLKRCSISDFFFAESQLVDTSLKTSKFASAVNMSFPRLGRIMPKILKLYNLKIYEKKGLL